MLILNLGRDFRFPTSSFMKILFDQFSFCDGSVSLVRDSFNSIINVRQPTIQL